MNELRRNPLTDRWVTIASSRAARPGDFARTRMPVETGPSRPCPFCPGNEDAFPPALETYGPGGDWLVRVVPNLYPAFQGEAPHHHDVLGPVFTQAPASGIHEVLVLSPDHGVSWGGLSDKQAGLVMAATRDRMEEHARHGVVVYTQVIVNNGREAGASLEHPHGQLLGIPFVPREIADELAAFDRERDCLLCTTVHEERAAGHRVVLDDDRVMVISPYWAGSPYELLVVPTRHAPDLITSEPADVVAVGRAVRDVLARLGRLLDDVAYNLVFHSAPHNHGDPYHWHVHVVPRVTSVAGFDVIRSGA
ncbi:MAG: galactose-1-phosphate uridylyltransferase, partial [Actinomycetota bacterium]